VRRTVATRIASGWTVRGSRHRAGGRPSSSGVTRAARRAAAADRGGRLRRARRAGRVGTHNVRLLADPYHLAAERFLRQVAKAYPRRRPHIVCDDYATNKHPTVKAWLARNPRITLHFTPTACLQDRERFGQHAGLRG
jgi:hypothetical protein